MTKRNKMATMPSFFMEERTQKADGNKIKSSHRMKGNKRYGNIY